MVVTRAVCMFSIFIAFFDLHSMWSHGWKPGFSIEKYTGKIHLLWEVAAESSKVDLWTRLYWFTSPFYCDRTGRFFSGIVFCIKSPFLMMVSLSFACNVFPRSVSTLYYILPLETINVYRRQLLGYLVEQEPEDNFYWQCFTQMYGIRV